MSRRGLLGLASGATAFTFWHRKAHSFPPAERYVDRVAAVQVADRAPPRPPILIDAQLASQAKAANAKNIYAELGTLARMMRTDPARYAVLMGNLLDGFGADHILWGTDTPVVGPPHWQIEAFQTFAIPEELAAQHGYSQLTPEVKNKIFGENAARIFGIDIGAARQPIRGDLLYKLRDDRNPLPAGAAPL